MAAVAATSTRERSHEVLRLLRAGKTRRAARAAAEVAGLAQDALHHRLHAAALREAGWAARSLVAARAALAASPGDPDAAFSAARSLAALGRVGEALDALDRLLAREADHAPALRLSGELLLLHDPEGAERRLRRACQVEPRRGASRVLLSEALGRQGRIDEAEAAEQAGLALDAALRDADRGKRAARAVGVAGLAAAFALAVTFWALSGTLERYWPGFGTGPTLVVGMVAPLLPLLLVVWMAVRLARAQAEAPDADLEALERTLGFEPEGEDGG